ncbi:MAG TPA: DinB family protein [Thermoanaerobaculia bacterium]|nr:DinB family protein [Thermoanaerobaculia bacterium]
MKKSVRALPILVFAIAFSSSVVLGQTTAPAATAATVSGLRADVIWQLNDLEKKLVSLAEAMPQDKFGWRPGAGVRSVSEVYMHVAGGNYFLPTFLGAKMPEGFSREMEKTVTEKAKVIDAMKKSFDHARKAVEATPDSDLDKKVKFFGQEPSERMMMIVLVSHGHEHLGQSIAYARTNGVAPPWSEGPPPAPEKKPATK